MATTPEYGEEELVREREAEAEKAVRNPLPPWDDIGEIEMEEHELEDERLMGRVAKNS